MIIPHVVFRVDSSTVMGSGHVMRCMTLAHSLKKSGWQVTFVSRVFNGHLINTIRSQGYDVRRLSSKSTSSLIIDQVAHASWLGVNWEIDANETIDCIQSLENEVDWLIIDHYAIDIRWELTVKPYVNQLMVIDDLADRVHECDILLDQNLLPNMTERYKGKVTSNTQLLLGPRFALLRPEFVKLREENNSSVHDPNRIMVFFGGSDPTDETRKALESILLLNKAQLLIDVVTGVGNPNLKKLQDFCSKEKNVTLHVQTPEMANLLLRTGLVIGAAGTNTWERCCLGTPSIIISIAENQVPIARAVHQMDMALYLGEASEVSVTKLSSAIKEFLNQPDKYDVMTRKCLEIVDGRGVERVVEVLKEKDGALL